jgi:GNAT superfamily N-acetyltransferase
MAAVRPATVDDRELLARIAAEGFFHDPVLSWVLPDDANRLGQLIHLFGGMVDDMLPDRGRVHLVDAASAAFWREPGFDQTRTASDRLEDAPADAPPPPYADDELARMAALSAAMHEAHPHEPHWYLNVVSTLPSHQSQGLGARVLAPVLVLADEAGQPCYLESTNPRNRTLYYRHGFEDMGDVEIDGGPSMRQMWREPRT